MLLSSKTETVDYLNVLAADRRQVRVEIQTSEPVRKPPSGRSPKLRAINRQARDEFESQFSGRRPFRGPVAIRLELTLPQRFARYGLRPIVKQHIDLLHGLAFANDKAVEHLAVRRRVADVELVRANLVCVPLSVFCEDFDRAFRVADELDLQAPARGWGAPFDEHDGWWLGHELGLLDAIDDLDTQEEEQLAEDPDAYVELEISESMREFTDRQVRAYNRELLVESIAHARGRWLCDQGIDSRDRPGPAPAWRREAHRLDTADLLTLPDSGPGCFMLPGPRTGRRASGEHPWQWHLESAIRLQLSAHHMTGARFSEPIALDIALGGDCAKHADVDNFAHTITRAFSKVLHRSPPEIGGYRAYRLETGEPRVRVRLMPQSRLRMLDEAIEQGRVLVHDRRTERRRAALA